MAVIEQHPYIDQNGQEHNDLVKHTSDEGKPLMQLETGRIYEEAVDKYPCAYTYIEYTEPAPEGEENAVDNAEQDNTQ